MLFIPSDRNRAEPFGAPLLDSRSFRGLLSPLQTICTSSALLPNRAMAIPLRVIRTPIGRGVNRETRRVTSLFNTFSKDSIGPVHRRLSAVSFAPAHLLLEYSAGRWQRPPPYYRRGHRPSRPCSPTLTLYSLRSAGRVACQFVLICRHSCAQKS